MKNSRVASVAARMARISFSQVHAPARSGKAHISEEFGLFRGADVGLRAGVQLNGRQVHFQQP